MRTRRNIALALALAAVMAVWATPALTASGEAENGGVAASDLTGDRSAPCPDLDTASRALIQGGCVVFAPATRTAMTARTMFGPLPFARCDIGFALHIGPAGDLWLQGMGIEGSGACGDILPCRQKAPEDRIHLAAKLPWKGTIRAKGDRLQAQLELCFDTCLGRFEGRTAFDLVKERGDWKLRTTDSIAGDSGFEIDGEWDLDATGLGARSAAYVRRAGTGAPGFDLR